MEMLQQVRAVANAVDRAFLNPEAVSDGKPLSTDTLAPCASSSGKPQGRAVGPQAVASSPPTLLGEPQTELNHPPEFKLQLADLVKTEFQKLVSEGGLPANEAAVKALANVQMRLKEASPGV
mmetsp:Transcript_23570/g.44934  ORF Transcript_23570/g.44934 Transcript_23570/m.44934 type:complete len:122 (-) Transcript_23570:759-1124(-)